MVVGSGVSVGDPGIGVNAAGVGVGSPSGVTVTGAGGNVLPGQQPRTTAVAARLAIVICGVQPVISTQHTAIQRQLITMHPLAA